MSDSEKPIHEIAVNRKARHDYEIVDTLECGIALRGTEVKTLRTGKVTLEGSFVRFLDSGMSWEQAHIAEYVEGNVHNHDPARPRRLLAHKQEARKWRQKMKEKGFTIIPLKIYFHGNNAKLLVGLARGRKRHDKRQQLRNKEARQQIRKHTR